MSGGLTRNCWQLANAARDNVVGCMELAAGGLQQALLNQLQPACTQSVPIYCCLSYVAAAASFPPAGIDSMRHNYLLLGLAIFQFPLNAWLARLPPLPAAAAATVKAAVNQATELLML